MCGKTKEEHDKNLKTFLNAVEEYNLTLNENKCVYASETINLVGYRMSKGILQPDPGRVKPVLDMPVPCNAKELRRMLGMFSNYAKWIPRYSEKIKPLVVLKKFHLNDEALHALTTLKTDLSSATLGVIDEDLPLTLETDTSDNAIPATLNQQGDRPVAFFSRMLNKRELHYSRVEKEALAIIEVVWKWAHFLTGSHFTVVTDQRSVSSMYSGENRGKIKNDEVLQWHMELNEFDFDIVHRSGKLNSAADALSRVYCVL